eukprot:6462666-Prymnesium_polylepis.2
MALSSEGLTSQGNGHRQFTLSRGVPTTGSVEHASSCGGDADGRMAPGCPELHVYAVLASVVVYVYDSPHPLVTTLTNAAGDASRLASHPSSAVNAVAPRSTSCAAAPSAWCNRAPSQSASRKVVFVANKSALALAPVGTFKITPNPTAVGRSIMTRSK